MDDKKDIRPIENKPASLKNFEYQTFFGGDSNFAFVFKKTEKIVAALYMISDLFENEEPLKWDIRQSSLGLMSYISAIKDNNSDGIDDIKIVEKIKNKILKILSLIDVAFLSGFISEMNISVLKKEFSHLLEALEKRKESLSQNNLLKSDFFYVEKTQDLSQVSNFGLIAKENFANNNRLVGNNYVASVAEKPASDYNNEYKPKNKPVFLGLSKANHMFNKDKRRNNILAIFKRTNEITIKDVLAVIKNCSEKTVQRELLSLVSEGILKKEGEKRWSKYSLVS